MTSILKSRQKEQMTATEIMRQLERLGNAQTRQTLARHGCPEPFFGVKIGDMKTLMKKVGTNSALAKELYKTGNPDAQYFAGLIADGGQLSKADLKQWAKKASWHMVAEFTVAWMAAEHPEGWEIALEWIDSPNESIAAGGWNTLSAIVSTRPDEELDLPAIKRLLKRITNEIHRSLNRVRYTMNSFVIAVGGSVAPLAGEAMAAAKVIGPVAVDMGDTACQVPVAKAYIQKIIDRGNQGKKRKSVKC
jgi:3-methyladenine DNA glycosylase AlkD